MWVKGPAIELFIDQINKGNPITLTDFRAKRYFMSIQEVQFGDQRYKLKRKQKNIYFRYGSTNITKRYYLQTREYKKNQKKNK